MTRRRPGRTATPKYDVVRPDEDGGPQVGRPVHDRIVDMTDNGGGIAMAWGKTGAIATFTVAQ